MNLGASFRLGKNLHVAPARVAWYLRSRRSSLTSEVNDPKSTIQGHVSLCSFGLRQKRKICSQAFTVTRLWHLTNTTIIMSHYPPVVLFEGLTIEISRPWSYLLLPSWSVSNREPLRPPGGFASRLFWCELRRQAEVLCHLSDHFSVAEGRKAAPWGDCLQIFFLFFREGFSKTRCGVRMLFKILVGGA